MKRYVFIPFLLAAMSLLCLSASAQEIETRTLTSFNRIKASASFEVILEKGSSESVRIEARNIDPQKVITEVADGRLRISLERGTYRRMQVKLFVTYRELNEIVTSGSGSFRGNDLIQAGELTIINSGSGNIYLARLEANELMVKLSGSANMQLAGRADNAFIQLSGSGNVEGFDLQAENAEAKISGSGNINLAVSRGIDAQISGSGNVRYRGNPTSTYVKTSGSGRVHAMN